MKRLGIIFAASMALFGCAKNEPDTPQPQPEETLEAVDLQLSVKWCSSNLKLNGQISYFAWGECKAKSAGSIWNYSHWDGKDCLKYNSDPNYPGVFDKKKVLESADDAAQANLGNGWRIPTASEWKELSDCCTWVWTSGNNPGYKITSKYNGKSIFLPADGFVYEGDATRKGEFGYYWSSTYNSECPIFATAVSFGKTAINIDSGIPRMYGLSLRPVSK